MSVLASEMMMLARTAQPRKCRVVITANQRGETGLQGEGNAFAGVKIETREAQGRAPQFLTHHCFFQAQKNRPKAVFLSGDTRRLLALVDRNE